ncbi:hypothetical protein AXF42_Ash015652 [Apostasia shenzhenica]|uniref:KANL3/Tex30 alpha/beta hydrolase-like domain-containing protein n=1 Tax=Apostasia shenzhenica TaxID=1088818 RepID=A0A2H9ZTZ4_9ASPA|nr:hypothetical protein AXF42_Ash015652 [Apostasia shenzhenica]
MATESMTVKSRDGVKLNAKLFRPKDPMSNLVVVLVHPFTVLGGFQGLLRGIAVGLAQRGLFAVTFDMRGAGCSSGRASLTGFAEIQDVVAICKWVSDMISPRGIVLMGSSAGAPIAGSAVDKIEQVVGYVSVGYPFGLVASILFGRHHESILRSIKPKLFIMGTKDGFTSVKQLENKLKSASGRVETHLLEGVGHFQMEGPAYDAHVVDIVINFIQSL